MEYEQPPGFKETLHWYKKFAPGKLVQDASAMCECLVKSIVTVFIAKDRFKIEIT